MACHASRDLQNPGIECRSPELQVDSLPFEPPGKPMLLLLLMLLSPFSCVQLFTTPWTAAYQAPPSMGFSRQEWGAIAFSKCYAHLTKYFSNTWRRHRPPTPVLLHGNSHGRRSLVGCSPWGRWKSHTTERLHFQFSLSCIGEGNGNPLQCSCLENPREGEPGGLPSMGSHRVGHD